MVSSHVATLLNSYLAGQCTLSRDRDDTEMALMDLELSVQQLASMGLEVLHPDVLLSPRFGQSELSPHAKVRPLLNKPKRALSRMPSRSERCERQTDGVGDQGDVFCSPTGSNTGALPTRQFSRRELHLFWGTCGAQPRDRLQERYHR